MSDSSAVEIDKLTHLGSSLMEFFDPDQLARGPDGKIIPPSLLDFLNAVGITHPQQAFTAAQKLVAEGLLMPIGQGSGPQILSSTYVAGAKASGGPDVYDFLVSGFPEIRRRLQHAVLHLAVKHKDGTPDSGTGFLISEILMMTAKHCVEAAEFSICDPRHPDTTIECTSAPFFKGADFAIVQVAPGHGLPHFALGQPNHLDLVMAMGYPALEGLEPSLVCSTGEVAGKAPSLVSSTGEVAGKAHSYLDGNSYWLTTCALTGGSSGGPVVNVRGQVVGVVSALPANDQSTRSAPFGLMVSPADGFVSLTASVMSELQ